MGYQHPDHGNMEWVETYKAYDEEVEAWRCTDCHVVAEPGRADEVFSEHDCGQYERVRKGITGES